MGRAIGAVIVAEVIWTGLWLGGSAAIGAATGSDLTDPIVSVPLLVGFLVYAVLVSAIAGFVCAAVRGASAMKTVWVFAVIQLILGIGFEASAWDLTPVWYHLIFLALLVPSIVWGGRLKTDGLAASA